MKKIQYIISAAAVLLLTACSNEKDALVEKQAVTFTTSLNNGTEVSSRLSGFSWDTDDRVGIYVAKSGTGNLYDANVCYNPNGTPIPDTDKGGYTLCYPSDGTAVDFTAYYPYDAKNTDGTIVYDFTSQGVLSNSSTNGGYVAQSTNKKSSDGNVALNFTHPLTEVDFVIEGEDNLKILDDVPLDRTMFKICSQPTSATLSLSSLTWTPSSTTGDIIPLTNVYEKSHKFAYIAFLMPDKSACEKKVKFILCTDNGSEIGTFTATIPSVQWMANNRYRYTLAVTRSALTVTSTSITGWGTETEL